MEPNTTVAGGSPLRVGLAGAGAIAMAHLSAWHAQSGARVCAIADSDSTRARRMAAEHGIGSWSGDYSELAARPELDAIDVCLPPRLHADAVVTYLTHGKHVLVEKPFVVDLAEARRVLETERDSGRTLMVAENWPYAPVTLAAQRLLGDNVLGEPFLLRAHHDSPYYLDTEHGGLDERLRAATAVGGYTMTAGIHSINLAAAMMGGIAAIAAMAVDESPSPAPYVERDVALNARFRNGGIGALSFTGRSRHNGERRLWFAVLGARGVLEFDLLRGLTSTVAGRTSTVAAPGGVQDALGFAAEIAHFCSCIRTGRRPVTEASTQLATLAAVLAVYRSLHERREVRPDDLLAEAGLGAYAGSPGRSQQENQQESQQGNQEGSTAR